MIFHVPSPSGSSITVPGLDTELNIESCLFHQYFIKLGHGTGRPGVKSQDLFKSIVNLSFVILFVGVSAHM